MKIRFHQYISICITSIVMWAVSADAQFNTPIQIAPSSPILNELGQPISGPHIPEEQRPLVHLIQVFGGKLPPNEDGTPQLPFNMIVTNTYVGSGAITQDPVEGAGRFNMNLEPNAMHDRDVFIRVYSHHTIQESTYYIDSEVQKLSGSNPEVYFNFGAVTNLLQPGTVRGDGLTDEMRRQLFGSASVDVFATMEDGRTVWDHFVAGTDWTDPDSFLAITSIRPLHEMSGGQPTLVGEILEWKSEAERVYTIQYATNLLLGGFENLSNAFRLDATPPLNVFTNLDVPAAAPIYYRVEVEWPDMPPEADDLIHP